MSKEIQLTQGKVAIVDDGDFGSLSQFEWSAHRSSCGRNWYARAKVAGADGKVRQIQMHRLLLLEFSRDNHVDHRDCDGLNNQRSNLRIADRFQNARNSRKMVRADRVLTSKFKGVSWCAGKRRWLAQVTCEGRAIQRYRRTQLAAALEYDGIAIQHFGEFARVNFPEASHAEIPQTT